MSDPFVGEIRMFGGNYAPAGWMFCAGQVLSISEYDMLFSLIGTTYGGDGQATFALPDLRGRQPWHQGSTPIGSMAGAETVTLTVDQIPSHTHLLAASGTQATSATPSRTVPAPWADGQYSAGPSDSTLATTAVGATGSTQPHENRPPYLAVNFIISLYGIYPSQN
jgi:microcystin-dependent protein